MSVMDDVHGALARLADATMARIAAAEMQRNEARERANRAEALLREAMAVLVRFESCLGAADMEEMAPGSQPLLAKIREVLT